MVLIIKLYSIQGRWVSSNNVGNDNSTSTELIFCPLLLLLLLLYYLVPRHHYLPVLLPIHLKKVLTQY
jgi:hypothetical protein